MKYIGLLLGFISTFCFSQFDRKIDYSEKDSIIYLEEINFDEIDLKTTDYWPWSYEINNKKISKPEFDETNRLKKITVWHENDTIAQQSELKYFQNDLGKTVQMVYTKTYYQNGALRSIELYHYGVGFYLDRLFTYDQYFFDLDSNLIENKLSRGKDTISGTYLTEIISDTMYVYTVYENCKSTLKFWVTGIRGNVFDLNNIRIHKIHDFKTNRTIDKTRKIKKEISGLSFMMFNMNLIISNQKNLKSYRMPKDFHYKYTIL